MLMCANDSHIWDSHIIDHILLITGKLGGFMGGPEQNFGNFT